MKYMDYFAFLVDEIHSVIAATTDEIGLPVTCAIDMMDWDENGLYFLTAKGKNFYHRLKQQKYIALTGMKGEDTMSSIALCFRFTPEKGNGLTCRKSQSSVTALPLEK